MIDFKSLDWIFGAFVEADMPSWFISKYLDEFPEGIMDVVMLVKKYCTGTDDDQEALRYVKLSIKAYLQAPEVLITQQGVIDLQEVPL